MKVSFLKKRLEELNKDSDWLADQCGVSRVTMRQNYLRGITPQKPVAIHMKNTLGCKYEDFLYPEELEVLSLADEAS